MLLSAIHHYAWLAPVLAACVYLSDYALTLWEATLYQAGANRHIRQELLAQHFERVFAERRFANPRFLLNLSSVVLWMLVARFMLFDLSAANKSAYDFAIGIFFLYEVTVHCTHFRDLHQFACAKRATGISGEFTCTLGVLYELSAGSYLLWSGVFLLCFALTDAWFFLGGTLVCAVIAYLRWQQAHKAATVEPASNP